MDIPSLMEAVFASIIGGFLCMGKYKPLFFISTPSGLDDVNNMSEAKTERF